MRDRSEYEEGKKEAGKESNVYIRLKSPTMVGIMASNSLSKHSKSSFQTNRFCIYGQTFNYNLMHFL